MPIIDFQLQQHLCETPGFGNLATKKGFGSVDSKLFAWGDICIERRHFIQTSVPTSSIVTTFVLKRLDILLGAAAVRDQCFKAYCPATLDGAFDRVWMKVLAMLPDFQHTKHKERIGAR